MNNLFEDLMYCAGLTAQGCWDEMDEHDKQAIEKFGDLILFECVKLAVFKGDKATAQAIKEHFGIEK